MADRIRMQTLALATTAFSQGVSFWQAGSDALRSKSFDGNSYDSGDWFNVLDPSFTVNGFGRGLPPSSTDKWSYAQPLLANPALKPARPTCGPPRPSRTPCCGSGRPARCCTSARRR